MSSAPDGLAVVHQLTNRRLYQASARVLDAVVDELAHVRRRTGGGPDLPLGGPTPGDYDLDVDSVAAVAAYESALRTAVTIRQRSLAEFLA